MRIAVPNERGRVHQNLNTCANISIFEVEDELVIRKENISCQKLRGKPKEFIEFLIDNDVNVLLCNSISIGERATLVKLRIELISSVTGMVNEVVVKFLSGERIGDED